MDVRQRLIALAIVGAAVLVTATTAEATRSPTLLAADFTSQFATRPAGMSFGVSGNLIIGGPNVSSQRFRSGRYGHIRWTRWTTRRALGYGTLWLNNCSPNCPEGTYEPSRVVIKASNERSGRYSDLSLLYRLHGKRADIHLALKRLHDTPVNWDWQ